MVADTTLRQLQVRDDITNSTRSFHEIPNDPQSGWIAKSPHKLREQLVAESVASCSKGGVFGAGRIKPFISG